jgi:cobalt-zinc-cadmium efflux system membrane fusion protein
MKTPSLISPAALTASLIALSLLLTACGEKSDAKDAHGASTPATAAAQAHDEPERLIHFTDKSELFLEFPPLIVGQPATFAAHLTRLADFKPFAQGKLTVVLTGGNAPEERFVANAPSAPGIFKPAVIPKAAGVREMTVIVESDLGTLTHVLGPVTVFADANAAKTGHGDNGHDEQGIAFSKEQQWKVDFATAEAVAGMARAAISATGTIRAPAGSEAQLVAPTAGVLRAANGFPRIGQVVRKGQTLAILGPRLGGDSDQASLDAAAGKAQVVVGQARRERERMETLFKDEAVAEKRLLDARANERIAQSELQAATARAQQLGGAGGIALKAPIDGVVADVSAAAGAFVNEGTPLLHIANTDKLWLDVRVPESEIGRIGKPTGAAFKVDGYEQAFTIDAGRNGKLIAVGGVVDAQTRTVPVIFEFANPERSLRLGLSAKVQVFAGAEQAQNKDSVLIPASAVQDENGTQVVYVQIGGERFERRIVQTGARDGERIAVVAGLEAGRRVVSKGAYLVRLSTSTAAAAGHAH